VADVDEVVCDDAEHLNSRGTGCTTNALANAKLTNVALIELMKTAVLAPVRMKSPTWWTPLRAMGSRTNPDVQRRLKAATEARDSARLEMIGWTPAAPNRRRSRPRRSIYRRIWKADGWRRGRPGDSL